MSHLNQDQIKRLCEDLVYQVGYAFYDVPYIILLNLMVQYGVARETDLTTSTQIQATEIRKYMGMLLTHRLIKRHANKERIPIPDYLLKKGDMERTRLKEVMYYYLDYREFANVVKYRIAMMRKGIDEKVMQDVGHKGYICPTCSRLYTPLQIRFNPSSNAFECEDDQSELTEYVPDESDSSDKMQRFNKATQPIRDALRAVEGVTLPTINIHAWVAENVTSVVETEVGGSGEGEAGKKGKVQVVLGGEGERERIEKERLAEQQRTQNALPVWHTHSTVTGSATTLGIADETASARHAAQKSAGGGVGKNGGMVGDGEDEMLMQHYEGMDEGDGGQEGYEDDVREAGGGGGGMEVKEEVKEFPEKNGLMSNTNGHAEVKNGGDIRKMITVNGVPKPLEKVTEEDQEEMTPDEYQAYYDAALAA